MATLIFRGAKIRFFDVRLDEGGVFARIHMTAELSQPVCERMGWDIGAGSSAGDLKGRLAASHLILTPNGRELKEHELQIPATEVSGFKWVEVTDKNNVAHNELRFQIRSNEEAVGAKLEHYFARIGADQGQLRLSYTKQESLDFEGEGEAEEAEVEEAASEPLASVQQISGGTPGRSKQRQRADAAELALRAKVDQAIDAAHGAN